MNRAERRLNERAGKAILSADPHEMCRVLKEMIDNGTSCAEEFHLARCFIANSSIGFADHFVTLVRDVYGLDIEYETRTAR
jgi:hypothetical protein